MDKNKRKLIEEIELKAAQLRLENEQRIKERLDREDKERKEKEKAEADAVAAQAKLEKDEADRIANAPKKCHVRTFTFVSGKKKEYHSICDKKDYSDGHSAIGKVTGKFAREENKEKAIKESKDTVHFIK